MLTTRLVTMREEEVDQWRGGGRLRERTQVVREEEVYPVTSVCFLPFTSWWDPQLVSLTNCERRKTYTPETGCIFSILLTFVLFLEGTCLNSLSFYCLFIFSWRVIVSIFYALILMSWESLDLAGHLVLKLFDFIFFSLNHTHAYLWVIN